MALVAAGDWKLAGARRVWPRGHGGGRKEYWGVAHSLARLFKPSGVQAGALELALDGNGGGRSVVETKTV